MEEQYATEKNLILLLSQFPAGLSLADIQHITSQQESLYGNWQQFLQSMTDENDLEAQTPKMEK